MKATSIFADSIQRSIFAINLSHIALAEEELKREFDRMEASGMTPMNFVWAQGSRTS